VADTTSPDVIVVGSGPGGVNCAAPLVEAGKHVLMLDYGNEDRHYAPLIPHEAFSTLRRTDANQHRYFIGDGFEGVPFGEVRVGAQLTPPRKHIMADAPALQPADSDDFAVSMSLARGGLGAGWSAGVFPFVDDELRDMGLSVADMQPHYDAVVERIGVCGPGEDLEPFFPMSPGVMPALDVDVNADTILARYQRKRAGLNEKGFFLGRPRLAVCTRQHRGRGPHGYLDLEYWADMDRSVYRPQWTLDELLQAPNFTYLNRRFVETFDEAGGGVRVHVRRADDGLAETHAGGALVLAAGTFGTARIVLRSLDRYETHIPMVCNAYCYVPMLNLGMLRRAARDRRYSLAQLTAMVRLPGRVLQSQVFSYRSLLTFKLMKEAPIAYREARKILQVLMPNFAILGIHHADRPSPQKYCVLHRGEPDRLEVRYHQAPDEERMQHEDERTLLGFFKQLGCIPLKTIRPGHGSSLHYGGTFPIRPESDDPLTCDRSSRLRATERVYVADGSIFPWLSPKGLTFNIMANANRVGALLAAS
jgi:choline dehydrogenase-like flavoprotein